MAKWIPDREDYYFDGTCFKVRSRLAKKIRTVMFVLCLAGGALTASSTNHPSIHPDIDLYIPTETAGIYKFIAETTSLSRKEVLHIVESLVKWGERFNVDPKLLAAIIMQESKFDPFAISRSGALGLMQVIPKWHLDKIIAAKNEVGTPELFNASTNIYLGAWVLSDCLKKYKLESALELCYSGGHRGYANSVLNHYKQIKSFSKGKNSNAD